MASLAKLGVRVSATKIRTPLRANGLGPAPRRGSPTWGEFLRAQAQGILAFDFFTVESLMLRTMYVLFAIELGSRRVHVLGITRNPDSAWVTQQARNLVVGERLGGVQFLIRDRDSKFSSPFDEVFRTDGVNIVKTPIRAPRANAFAGAVGPHGANRVPGLDAGARQPPPGARAPDLRRPLQRGQAPSRSQPEDPGTSAGFASISGRW